MKKVIFILVLTAVSMLVFPQVFAVGGEHVETGYVCEAEYGSLSRHMTIKYDNRYAGEGKYITAVSGIGKRTASVPDALYNLNVIEAGSYDIWVKVNSRSIFADSFYLFCGDSNYTVYISPNVSEFRWIKAVNQIYLEVGKVDFGFAYRQPLVGIDSFLITDTDKADVNPDLEPKFNAGTGTGIEEPQYDENGYPIVPNMHPILFVNSESLPMLREKLNDPFVLKAWTTMKEQAENSSDGTLPTSASGNYDRNVLYAIEAKAAMYLLENDVKAGQSAVSMMGNFLSSVTFQNVEAARHNQGQVLMTGALVYDWCYPIMSSGTRQSFISGFKSIAAGMPIGYPNLRAGSVVSHNSEFQVMRDLFAAGIATYHEDSEMYNLVIKRLMDEFVPVRNFAYKSHTYHQGIYYGNGLRYIPELYNRALFESIGFFDIYTEDQLQVPYSYIYFRRPDGTLLRFGDAATSGLQLFDYYSSPPVYLLSSALKKDPILQQEFLWQYDIKPNMGIGGVDPIWILLFYNPELEAQDHSLLPLTRYFDSPMGMMVARTGWDLGKDAETVVASFKVGEYNFNNHDHKEAGSFQIYYKGGLAITNGLYQSTNSGSGSPHFMNYNVRTISKNSLLIYDPNETFLWYRTPIANDGGQRVINNAQEPLNLANILNNGYKTGEVLAAQSGPDEITPDYSYMKGDITEAYTNKVSKVERSFVFFNLDNKDYPAAMVVFDNITATNAFKKTFLLQSAEEPQIETGKVVIKRQEYGYNGKLVNHILLPVTGGYTTEKIGGEGSEALVEGTNYPAEPLVSGHEGSGWRVEISDKGNAGNTKFLNVMQVSEADSQVPELPTTMLEDSKTVGAVIADRAVTFPKEPQNLTTGFSVTLPNGKALYKVLSTGLNPGVWEVVSPLGETLYYEATEEGGCIYFDAAPGIYTVNPSQNDGDDLMVTDGAVTSSLTKREINIKVKSSFIYTEKYPYMKGDIVMIPLKDVLKVFEGEFLYDESEQTATIDDGYKHTVIKIGDKTIEVDSVEETLQEAPEITDDGIFIPACLLRNAFNAEINWDLKTKTLTITPENRPLTPFEADAYKINNIFSSGEGEDLTTSIYNVADNNLGTRWSAEGEGRWIALDMGEEVKVSAIGIAWSSGNARRASFEILVSNDGNTYKTVVKKGLSSGQTTNIEKVMFGEKVKARYIKVIGYGNSVNKWNSITELRVFQ